jgi:F0F1-type ATP synthase assembly protein I
MENQTPGNHKPAGEKRIMKQMAPYMGLGSQLTAAVAVMGFLGWWLDGKFETKPVLFIVFLVLGVFVGMYQFISTVSKLNNKK